MYEYKEGLADFGKTLFRYGPVNAPDISKAHNKK